jgi:predicted phage terminase large subunit-like protein
MDGHKVIVGVEQEPGSGGKESAENTVRNLAGYVVRVDRPSGDKAQRADPYSTQVNSGNVYMVKGEWNRAYIEELRFFSLLNSKEKDQVDASSGGFKLLNRPVAGGWKI